MSDYLKKEDYEEPACLLCSNGGGKISVDRVIERLDGFFSKNDYDGAERHLLYWFNEACALGDKRGCFAVCNELMGLYRKTGKKEQALNYANKALQLANELNILNEVSGATALVNAATVYKAFDLPEKSLELFLTAQNIYERELTDNDFRLGSLYNNMALTLGALKQYESAKKYFNLALCVMDKSQDGALHKAITYLNLADLAAESLKSEQAEEKIDEYLSAAEKLLNCESIARNGYYAFVCEKCATAFGLYGWFAFKNELLKRVRDIYERS